MKGQVFTVAKLHYINGVVYATGIKGSTALSSMPELFYDSTKNNQRRPALAFSVVCLQDDN